MRLLLPFLFVLPGCGLTLDYDPPTDGGMDAAADAPDAAGPECRTEVDCDDADRCNGRERCEDGVCVDGNDPIVCPDLDDDVCTGTPTCDPSSGECVPGAPPSCPADDGDPCNGIEQCVPALGCAALDPLDCDDGIDCTVDRCETDGCRHVPSDGLCTDGPAGVCGDLGCSYGCSADGDCMSDDPCLLPGVCESGRCTFRVRPCMPGQMCCGGACVPLGCNDDEHCTRDFCDRTMGCVHAPRIDACDDGDACTVGDRCEAGACVSNTERACGTTLACHAPTCDPATGVCGMEPVTGGPCLDDDPCSLGDSCVDGVCVGGPGRPTCDDGNPCTSDVCAAPGGCDNPPLPDGTTCTTLFATGVCMGGTCTFRSLCPTGMADCDGDDVCECDGRCVPDATGGLSCVGAEDCTTRGCGFGEGCCTIPGAEYGTCYSMMCLACCAGID